MTNELIPKIRSEIERLIEESGFDESANLYSLLSFLDSLEPEKLTQEEWELNSLAYLEQLGYTCIPEGVTEKLEKEIDRFEDWMETYNQADYPTSFTTRDIARHFYELGCRRTAEKYDEIEYNRQRAEESVPNELEEAAEELALTWEDIKTIEQIIATSDWYDFEINGKLWSKEFYEEVLTRFKEFKKDGKD